MTTSVETTTPAATEPLYDAKRGIYYTKPRFRGWSHLIGFEISLVVGTLALVHAQGAREITSLAIYVSSVSALFGVSALYHRGNWTTRSNQVLQRMDHAMIFFLIAGTATPAFLLANHGAYGIICLTLMWACTLIAAAIHMAWMNAPEALVGGTFIGLGCTAAAALPAVWINGGVAPGTLMIAGGLLYILGAISYHRRWLDRSPAVFGYHEVFHAYVCAAAACQYVAIALFIV